jgi:Restriction endonuclease
MPNVVIWNIDRDNQQFFADELKAGRLRQGWGYEDRLDLRLIAQKNTANQSLDEDESAAWERLNGLVEWIAKSDIIVVKNTPTWGFYTLVEVIGDYHFDRNTPTGDHAHFLDVKILREINKHSIHVSGDLRSSIDRAQWPVTVSIKRHDEILNLLQQPAEALTPTVPWLHRIRPQSSNITTLVKDIINKLSPTEFEELIQKLLDEMKFENTQLTAGAGEHGADVVMSVSTPFFDEMPRRTGGLTGDFTNTSTNFP